jgi:succinoglycan biosynthesis transport protein ExoP
LPIMGVIPLVKANAKAAAKGSEGETPVAPTLFTWHRPKSKEAESYRAVRTALYFSTRGQGRTLLQVTSPNQGDGKSTLAANLAVSIAQSGKSILLVDGDLRRPHVGRLFGVSQQVGFAAVLGGLAEPNEAISPTVVPGLSVLPAGATPPNPAELLTGSRLREVLDWLRERYDYVIVDTPPLLAVTDPGVVASQVDGVIMALRPSKRNRVEAKRAKEILTNLGVNIFGLVVNALDLTKSHESYGSYYYGYGYYAQGYYKEDTEDSEGNGEPQPSHAEHLENGESPHEGNGSPLSGL